MTHVCRRRGMRGSLPSSRRSPRLRSSGGTRHIGSWFDDEGREETRTRTRRRRAGRRRSSVRRSFLSLSFSSLCLFTYFFTGVCNADRHLSYFFRFATRFAHVYSPTRSTEALSLLPPFLLRRITQNIKDIHWLTV